MDLTEFIKDQNDTILTYLSDSYCRSENCNLTKLAMDDKKSLYFLLDKTVFHPKSGGQPSDRGTLVANEFSLDVRKAMMVQGKIVHWAKITNGQPQTGPAKAEIDWTSRYLYMRRHSAAHLLDHCLTKTTGKAVETVDSWVGDNSYVGYAGSPPTVVDLEATQQLENDMITQGGQILISLTTRANLMQIAPSAPNIARLPNLPNLRIVTIQGCDPIPCGGTHLQNITEIHSLRILQTESTQSGYRVYFDLA